MSYTKKHPYPWELVKSWKHYTIIPAQDSVQQTCEKQLLREESSYKIKLKSRLIC
jgi:hypothetical protein